MPYPHTGYRLAVVAAIVVLTTLSTATGQSVPDRPPLRSGNIYDHRDHQPTQADIRASERDAGRAVQAAQDANVEKVEKEIRTLLEQIDELDKQAEQEGKNDR